MADPNAITVLLTGRLATYTERIKHITEGVGLKFDHYGLKPAPYLFTMEFKLNFISDLVEKYRREGLYKVVIYEDREEHATRFRNLSKTLRMECEVIDVEPNVTFINTDKEIELVKKLIELNSSQLQLEEQPAYTGVLLDEESHKALLAWIPTPANWTVAAHHMTIAFGNQEVPGGLKVGDEVELEVTAVGFDTRALAAKVTGVPTTNAIAHVTIAHSRDAKAADSNRIAAWDDIESLRAQGGVVTQKSASAPPIVISVSSVIVAQDDATSVASSSALLTIQTNFPPQPRLRGTVRVRTTYGIAAPPPRVVERLLIPIGTSIGDIIKRHHPGLQGKQIGDIVKQTRAWTSKKGVEVTLEELDEFIKNISLSN